MTLIPTTAGLVPSSPQSVSASPIYDLILSGSGAPKYLTPRRPPADTHTQLHNPRLTGESAVSEHVESGTDSGNYRLRAFGKGLMSVFGLGDPLAQKPIQRVDPSLFDSIKHADRLG